MITVHGLLPQHRVAIHQTGVLYVVVGRSRGIGGETHLSEGQHPSLALIIHLPFVSVPVCTIEQEGDCQHNGNINELASEFCLERIYPDCNSSFLCWSCWLERR